MFRTPCKSGGSAGAAGLLVVLSLLKDDAPWVYESGMQIYKAMLTGDRNSVTSAHEQFETAMELVGRGPWVRELYRPDDEGSFTLLRYLPELVDRLVAEHVDSLVVRKRTVKPAEPSSGDKQT